MARSAGVKRLAHQPGFGFVGFVGFPGPCSGRLDFGMPRRKSAAMRLRCRSCWLAGFVFRLATGPPPPDKLYKCEYFKNGTKIIRPRTRGESARMGLAQKDPLNLLLSLRLINPD